MKNWQISRRTMLKGVGAMLSLPLLEVMEPPPLLAGLNPASGAASKYPVRTAVLYMPNGVNPQAWAPQGTWLRL